jgi:ribonucleoside-diphosphate reductase alpha chain
MRVIKRNGKIEDVSFDKITQRLRVIQKEQGLEHLDIIPVVQSVVSYIHDNISTQEIDNITARILMSMSSTVYDYQRLASVIVVSNLHKRTLKKFSKKARLLYKHGLLSKKVYNFAINNADQIDNLIDYDRDYLLDFFGFKTLERGYLQRINGEVTECPQDIFMRVSIALWCDTGFSAIADSYNMLSRKFFSHATPTLFNVGTMREQAASCFAKYTEVLTTSGVKMIQDINIGDSVVTHTGEIKQVLQIHKNLRNNRDIKELKVTNTKPIHVTEDHHFWAVTKNDLTPRWISISDMKGGDYIAIPNAIIEGDTFEIDITKYLSLPKNYSLEEVNGQVRTIYHQYDTRFKNKQGLMIQRSNYTNKLWNIDEDFSVFLGVFIGDGHIIMNKSKDGEQVVRGIGFTIYNEHQKLIDFISNVGTKVFGFKPSYHFMKTQNVTRVLFASKIVGMVIKSLTGHYFDGKKLNDIFFKFPTKLIHGLVAGLITSDGCIPKPLNSSITVQMSNKELINQLYHLTRMHGIETSFLKVKKPLDWKYNQPYMMSIPNMHEIVHKTIKYYPDDDRINQRLIHCKDKNNIKNINNQKFLKIQHIKDTELTPEFVYTLGVEDNHSYNVEGLIAQNCFLLHCGDSIDSMYKTISDCAKISKWAGGIGVNISDIRASDSRINGTNGKTSGIIPMLRVFNNTALHVNQGGKRPGSFAFYLEPHHPDILDFLDVRKNHGDESRRARDIFTAVWLNDLFMERIKNNEVWSLLNPQDCPGLTEVYGKEYKTLYQKYESEGKFMSQLPARDLWKAIITSQIETGTPYLANKDAVNEMSNQKNIGVIKGSNLCIEICEYTSPEEHAVCTLASICLPMCVEDGTFNYNKLREVAHQVTRNLNKLIDINFYPVPETETSNKRHRPLGIGIQGLADVYLSLGFAYDSPEAAEINKKISETLYFSALEASADIAEIEGTYSTFDGSDLSKGIFHFERFAERTGKPVELSGLWDFESLRERILSVGVRNSLLIALMPTASTSQIMGNTESFEPITANIYTRKTLAGDFIVINKFLVRELESLGLYNEALKNKIIASDGSVQSILEIPEDIRKKYKTVWELKQKVLIDQSAARTPFVCQSQSLNLYFKNPTFSIIHSAMTYAHQCSLKTMIYYTRTLAVGSSTQFTIAKATAVSVQEQNDPANCESCSG